MKIYFKITSVLMIAALMSAVVISGCKSKEKAASTKDQGETLIEVYCSGPEFQSNNEYFRANQVGESVDQATAKKKAMSNARADLASAIQTRVKAVIDNYVNSRELNNVEEAEERFESLSREVIDQELTGVKTICEKTTKTSTGNYKTYIALELAGDELMNAMNARLSQDDKLKIDYDYEQFKKTFDAEMDKMAKERGN
jgi:pyruvate/2-oxoacid:ferredoxin oxidoreductase beta subunit